MLCHWFNSLQLDIAAFQRVPDRSDTFVLFLLLILPLIVSSVSKS